MSRKSLGRGLSALIPEEETIQTEITQKDEIVTEASISLISPNPYQPRKVFDDEKLEDLVQSIKEHGIIQPVVVSRFKSGYQIVVGERRLRAAQKAGLERIPVIIKEVSKKEQIELALVENLQREDLNPIEEAEGYNLLMGELGLTQEDLSKRIGKSRPAIANTLRLMGLPDKVKEMLISGVLTSGHAKSLLSLDSPSLIIKTAEEVIKLSLSVRQTEELVKRSLNFKNKIKRVNNTEVDYSALRDLEQRIRISLGTRVQILAKEGDKGKIELHYFSQDDFARIVALLLMDESDRGDNTIGIDLL